MSQHTKNEVMAGALIVAGFILLSASLYVIADLGKLFAPRMTHYLSFDRVEGLRVDDDVLYAGIKCGRVSDIRYQQMDNVEAVGAAKTRVLVAIVVDARTPLTFGDLPRVNRGFTGSVALNITPWRQGQPVDPRDPPPGTELATSAGNPLRGSHSADFSELADEARAVIAQFRGQLGKVGNTLDNIKLASDDVKKITGDVRDLVQRNTGKVDDIIAKADKTAENAENATGKLKTDAQAFMATANDAIGSAKKAVEEAKAKIEELLPTFSSIAGRIDNATSNVELASRTVRKTIDSAAPKVDAAAGDIKTITGNVRDIVVANRPSIDQTIEQLRQASGRLNLAMEDVRRNPWKLLNRNIEADAYTQNIYDASMAFADGARSLAGASASFQALAAAPGADREALRKSTEKLTQLVTEMSKLEQALYDAMKNHPPK